MAREFSRSDRVSSLLRKEIAQMVHAQVREHGLPSVSVSDVEVSRDLSHAKVFVTALMPESAEEAITGLNALAGEFRHQLGRMLRMRVIPILRFHYDGSVDEGERIEALLRAHPPAPESDDGSTG